jgi:hypothetical protein
VVALDRFAEEDRPGAAHDHPHDPEEEPRPELRTEPWTARTS